MADLPTGTVTFLFTDIEGSTQLVKRLRDGYGDMLADHRELLRAAFARHGGSEIDTQGDSFFVAFPSAREAVLTAVEGQRALARHEWPEGVNVRVRMGIHTGRAVAAEGRYTGLAVHRAARISAAGHGGQILVSQSTHALLEDDEEELEIEFKDLGEHPLKDLDRPVRLYQVAAPGLRTDFAPPRTEAALAAAAEGALAPPRPIYRRPDVLALAALAAVVLAVAAITLRSGADGLSAIRPNHVGMIDAASGEIVAEVPVGLRPGALAVAPNAVWVANEQDRTLTRIDPRQRAATGSVSLDATPTGLAVGAGGVWVALGLLGQLLRVDPEFRQITDTIDVAGRTPLGTVAVGAGSVWAAFGDSTLARVDPAAVRLTESVIAGSEPVALVVALGDVWVVNSGEGGSSVTRFRPTTFEEGAIQRISVGRSPSGLAFGSRSLWVPNSADDTVSRVDPDVGTRTISVGDEPVAVAFGAGAAWVANRADRTVSKIDPDTNEVVDTIEVASAPAALAVGHGFVWVSAEAP